MYKGRSAAHLAAEAEERFGLEVLVSDEDDMAVINDLIYLELCKGDIKESSRRACIDIIRRLTIRGVEGVLLGRTMLSIVDGVWFLCYYCNQVQ